MRNTLALHWALLVALLAFPVGASAQDATAPEKRDVDPYFVESSGISSNRGPQVITRNVLQDRTGVFWLATWHGVMRFDGTTFTNVTNKEGLRRYRAFSLLEDHQDNVWLGTTGAGLYRYDGKTYTNFTTKDGLVDNTVLSMMQDSANNIWFGGMGLTKYDGTTFTSFTEEDGFTSSDVHSISQSPDGTMWFGTRGALFRYDGTTFVDFTEEHGVNIERNSYTPALIDRRGHVWFSGSKGIYHYDGEQVQHVFAPASFSLMEDSRGHIWFSGGALKGKDPRPGTSVLNRFDPAAGLENILAAREQIEVKTGAIFGLSEDKDGNIWFGTGRGIGRIHGDTVQFFHRRAKSEPVAVDARVLDGYVGRYQASTGDTVTIRTHEGLLVAEVQGERMNLIAESAARFRVPDDESAITFFTAATGQEGLWASQRVWRKLPGTPTGVSGSNGPGKRSALEARSAGEFLVFRNAASWGRQTDFEDVLGALGCKYEQRESSAMADLELSPYGVIIIPGAQGSEYYNDYVSQVERFNEYVANGGTLLFELNGAENTSIMLPRGVTMASHGAVENAILASDHPILLPLSGERLIRANYASHGYLRDVPSDALILAVEANGEEALADRPTFIEYAHGKGRVIAACQCLHDQDESGRGPLMESVISYSLARSWAAEN